MSPAQLTRALVVVVLACSVGVGCFDPTLPKGAQLLCARDADCTGGDVCDPASARCVSADARAPRLVSATLSPEEAGAGATVTLTIVADTDLAVPPALLFVDGAVDGDPGFDGGNVDGPSATFHLDVDDTTPADGFYPLASVTLTGTQGLARNAPVDLALHVDRRAPRVDLFVDSPAGGVLTDLPDADTLTLTYDADEPLAEVAASLEGALTDATCADGTCTVVVTGVTQAELTSSDVIVTATDRAGNEVTARARVPVDFGPPALLAFTVAIESPTGRAETAASLGSTLVVSLFADEPLGAPPVIAFAAGPLVGTSAPIVTATDANGFAWEARLTIITVGDIADDASGALSATLRDVAGHDALVNAQASVALVEARGSGCAPLVIGDPCIDADADGFALRAPGCGDDCDDTNALVHPGALEIPGDGVGNDCDAPQEVPLDDDAGVFVDIADGTDTPDCGSRVAPCRSIGTAIDHEPGARLLLRASTDLDIVAAPITVPVIGGLLRNGATWTQPDPSAGSTSFVSLQDMRAPLLVGIATDGSMTATTGAGVLVVARSFIGDDLEVNRRARVIDVYVTDNINIRAAGTTVIDSVVGNALMTFEPATLVVRSFAEVSMMATTPDSEIEIVSSVFNQLICTGCARGRLVHDTIYGDLGNAIEVSLGGAVDVDNCIIHEVAPTALVRLDGQQRFTIYGSQLSGGDAEPLVVVGAGPTYPLTALALFEEAIGGLAGGNVASASPAIDSEGTLLPPGGTAPHVGAPFGAVATSAALDYFGDCRDPDDLVAGADGTR